MSIFKEVSNAVSRMAPPVASTKKQKIRSIDIERVDNGFVATTRYLDKGKSGEPGRYVEPTRKVFQTADGLAEHVKQFDD